MITTTHARPLLHASLNVHPFTKSVVCPYCRETLGTAHGAQQTRELLAIHCCAAAGRELLQPSTALPFN